MEIMIDFPNAFQINDRTIGEMEPCLVIAEAGVNHFGDIYKAFELVDLAVSAKADVFKMQYFYTDRLIGVTAPEWRERMRSKELKPSELMKIKEYCESRGIIFMCTPHDDYALDFLNHELNVSAFKIGSGEVENWPFLAQVAKCKKPIILSTGMYRLDQIKLAMKVLKDNGCTALSILHCVTGYPANPELINLKVMEKIRSFFKGPVGYSDHTIGTAVPLAAVALGAKVLEKHITIDKNIPNAQDWKVSCDPNNFCQFVEDIRSIENAIGIDKKIISKLEQESMLWARKSIHLTKDIPAGIVFSAEMFVGQRPGDGISPAELGLILGKRSARPLVFGEKLTWKDVIS